MPLLSRPRAAQAEGPLQPPLAAWSRPACPAPASTGHFPGRWELTACLPRCCPGGASPGAWHTERKVHSSPWSGGHDWPGSASRQKGTLAPSLKGSVTLGKSFRLWSVNGADHSLCSPGCESIPPPPRPPRCHALGLSQCWPSGASWRGIPFLEPSETDSCPVKWALTSCHSQSPHSQSQDTASVRCPSVCRPGIPPQRNQSPRVYCVPFTVSWGEAAREGERGERKSKPTYWFQMWPSLTALRSNLIKFPQTARRVS